MRKVIVLMALVLLPALSGPANADLMAIWDFGPNLGGYTEDVTTEYVIGTPTLVLDGGRKDENGKTGVAYLDAEGTLHLGGGDYRAAAWDDVRVTGKDADWIMTINTTGWQDMAIRWDYRSQESQTFDLDYRVGGSGDWIAIVEDKPITHDNTWDIFSYNLSSITAIENQSIVEFRMYDLDENGNNAYRFDNLEMTGVPEPCSIALLGIGALMALTRKRRSALKTKN